MLDWLRRSPRDSSTIELGDRAVPIVVRRLGQARRMTLRLAPDGSEVRVSIPRWGLTEDALSFARSRQDWLAGQLARVAAPIAIGPGAELAFRGIALRIDHDPKAPRRPSVVDSAIRIGGPVDGIAARVRRWLEAEARLLLAADLADYCARIGREPPRLALSNARRRWGSCAGDGAIRINWRLIMAPDFVRRSVVAHEVAHLVHFDHSPRFHAQLAEIYEDDIKRADRWLKREGRGLYAAFG